MSSVIVSGAVANKHRHGGSIWVRMSWAESLRSLGHDVLFVEELSDASAVDAAGRRAEPARSANADVFDAAMAEFGFADSSALLDGDGGCLRGLHRAQLEERFEGADLLVNISGHLRRPDLVAMPRCRAFIDLDPGYTQVWHADGHAVGMEEHDLHFTVGANVGTARCPLPTGGVRWRPIRQPVVLDRWPVNREPFNRYTTVGSWRGAYGPVQWRGKTYGVKAHEFRPLADVPRRAGLPFEIALDLHPADAADSQRLRDGGWRVVGSDRTASTAAFADYVRRSGAEFSAAQGIYVHTRTGWCSDRTVRYLASGRPALVQDTGQSDTLSTGAGLMTFSGADEAVELAHEIVADYPRHCAAARALAESCFAPPAALAPLLELSGIGR
jgi:hypothetical protein